MYGYHHRSSILRDLMYYRATTALLIINIVAYAIFSILSLNPIVLSNSVIFMFAENSYMVFHGAYWQLVTAMFVHFNIIHIAANMVFLYILGTRLEVHRGGSTVIIVYFLTGLLGNVLSLILPLNTLSAGASGAIFGLFAYLAVILGGRREFSRAAGTVFIFWVASVGLNVNIIAHFGGMIGGLILGWLDINGMYRLPSKKYFGEDWTYGYGY